MYFVNCKWIPQQVTLVNLFEIFGFHERLSSVLLEIDANFAESGIKKFDYVIDQFIFIAVSAYVCEIQNN